MPALCFDKVSTRSKKRVCESAGVCAHVCVPTETHHDGISSQIIFINEMRKQKNPYTNMGKKTTLITYTLTNQTDIQG